MPRRTTLSTRPAGRTLAGSVALLLAAVVAPVAPAAAVAPELWPEGSWGNCSDAQPTYCIQEATVTPAGGVPTPVGDLGLTASVTTLPDVREDAVTSFNWAVANWETAAEQALGGDVTLVIRTGEFVPRYTMALAQSMRISRTTDDAGNYTMTITGRAVGIDWTTADGLFGPCVAGATCGGLDTMADGPGQPGYGYRFSGNTQDLETWGEENRDNLDGMYIASDAQARPTTIMYGTYPEPYWSMPVLGNPHLDASGNPVRGSFNAWLPESYFTAMGSTVEQATETGFDVMSREGPTATPVSVPAEVSTRDGGVGIDVKDLGYSVHQIDVFNQPSPVDPDAVVPGYARQVQVARAAGGLAVTWAAPESNGGSPITGYTARAFTAATGGSVAGRCTATTGTTCTIAGLTNGTLYYVAASASNALGEGRSATRVGVTAGPPSSTPPSAPTGLRLAAANARVVATWAAPAATGGAAVTGYTARAYRTATGGSPVRSCSTVGSGRSCALTALANGTTYYVSAQASNAAGAGPESARVAATPRTTATAPRTVTATSSARRVRVAWSPPAATGGSAVTGYRASLYLTSQGGSVVGTCSGSAAARSCTTAALTADRTYYVAVTALNAAGASVPSARARVLVRR